MDLWRKPASPILLATSSKSASSPPAPRRRPARRRRGSRRKVRHLPTRAAGSRHRSWGSWMRLANGCRWKALPDQCSHYGPRGIILMTILQSWSQSVEVWSLEGMRKLYWSGPIADDSRPGRTKTNAEQRDQAANGTRERPPMPSLSAQAFDVLLAAELDDLRRRQQPGLNQPRPHARRHGSAQNSEVWRDQLLAGIEDLAGELKRKVAHFALLCAVQSSDEASVRANASAVAWMQEALEDIAATALGMEMESRKRLQARPIFSGRVRPRSRS